MKKETEGSDRFPIHRCIRCGRYRFDNEMWETATLRSGGSGYMDEIESICLRCAPKIQKLMQPYLDEKRYKMESESQHLKNFIAGARTGRIPSAPLEEPKKTCSNCSYFLADPEKDAPGGGCTRHLTDQNKLDVCNDWSTKDGRVDEKEDILRKLW